MIPFDPAIATAGLIVGVLVGLTGMGGGSLMAPILILVVGVRPLFVVGTDLVYAAIAKVFGAWQHQQLGHVDKRVVWSLALGSIPGSLLGVLLLVRVRDTFGSDVDTFVLHVLGVVLILVAVTIILRQLPWTRRATGRFDIFADLTLSRRIGIGLIGAVIGLLVGLTSIGSGTLIVAFLSLFSSLAPRRLVGTDVFHGALLSGAAAIAHGFAGNVDFAVTASLLVGAVPGVLIGSCLTARIPERGVSTIVAGVLLFSGFKLL